MTTALLSHQGSDTQYALVFLVKTRARNGDVQGALRAARVYSNSDTREKAIREIAIAQAKSGDVQGARQTISLLTDAGPALEAIAVVQAEKGDIRSARETIAGLIAPNRALEAIGESQIKSGNFEGALETIGQMSPGQTGNLLIDLGRELQKRGQQARVRDLASHITNRELARAFLYYSRYAQSNVEPTAVVVADACAQANSDAVKGNFAAAYGLLAQGKCMYSFVAIKQYPTDPAGAEQALRRSSDPMDTCFGLTELATAAAAKGNIPDALRFIDAAQKGCGEKYGYLFGAVQQVARQWTLRDKPKKVVGPSPGQRERALLGMAEALGHPHP